MNRAPAFQFYPKDWLDFRVQRMSLAAQGAYLKLLCFMWADSPNQCSIIDNNELLARAIGTTVEQWLELRAEIQCESDPIFEEKSGCLVSARLRLEASKQRKYRESQAEKGKIGSTAVQPWLNRDSTGVPTGTQLFIFIFFFNKERRRGLLLPGRVRCGRGPERLESDTGSEDRLVL